MTGQRVSFDQGLIQRLEAAATDALPSEACGLLTGRRLPGSVTIESVHFSANIAEGNPESTFEIDPALHIRLARDERTGGPALLGVWHSHPRSRAEPSETDRMRARVVPGWVWGITGRPDDASTWQTRWFWL